MIRTKKSQHVAKNSYWRRVQAVETIEMPKQGLGKSNSGAFWTSATSFVNADEKLEKSQTSITYRNKKSM